MRIASFAKRVVQVANWAFLPALVFISVDSWACHDGVPVSARKRQDNRYQSRWYEIDVFRGGAYLEHFYDNSHDALRIEHPWRVFHSEWRSAKHLDFSANRRSRRAWLLGTEYLHKSGSDLESNWGIESIELPLWPMILVAVIWPTRMVLTWRRQDRRRRLRLCLGCGYDLRGATGNRCSECGHEIPGDSATPNQVTPDFTVPTSAQA